MIAFTISHLDFMSKVVENGGTTVCGLERAPSAKPQQPLRLNANLTICSPWPLTLYLIDDPGAPKPEKAVPLI